jgi:hypothetical protein
VKSIICIENDYGYERERCDNKYKRITEIMSTKGSGGTMDNECRCAAYRMCHWLVAFLLLERFRFVFAHFCEG